jgi:cobalt/nickel transport system permease protein
MMSAPAKIILALGVVLLTVAAPPGTWWYFTILTMVLVLATLAMRVRFMATRWLWFVPLLLLPGGGWLVWKGALCVTTMMLLANTTPFTEILRLTRRAGVPALLVSTVALLYRYLSVLVDETQRMQRARQARTFRPRSRRERWQMLGALAGELFVRSTERAERIYTAMCARGWR